LDELGRLIRLIYTRYGITLRGLGALKKAAEFAFGQAEYTGKGLMCQAKKDYHMWYLNLT